MTAHALWITGWALLAISLAIFAGALAETARARLVRVTVRKETRQ